MKLKFIASTFGIFIIASLSDVYAEEAVHPSFDCTKAVQPIEEVICNDNDLAGLDHRMAEEFRKVIDASPVESRPVIIDEQRDWLKRRDHCLPEVRHTAAGCLKDAYSTWLESWPQKLAALGGATGTSFTLKITKYPGLPILVMSERGDLCDRLKDAAVSNFQRPNRIHFLDAMDGSVRRLTVWGARWLDLTENAETAGMYQVSVIPMLSPKGRVPYDLVLTSHEATYLTQQQSLYAVPRDQFAALKGALERVEKLPLSAEVLIDGPVSEGGNPIQVLRYGIDDYLAEEKNWSEIQLSKIRPGRALQPTCLLKYPAVSRVGPAFNQWLANIQQIQGEEGHFAGTAHFLIRHLEERMSLAQLAVSRPADIVQFGANWPTIQGDYDSPLQSKLGVALWGLDGPWNHAKARRLEIDTNSARAALVDYYVTTYGVGSADAAHAAEITTDTILMASFYFYSYGEEDRKGKGDPAEVEQSIRSQADEFARRPAGERKEKDASDLIRAAILAGASKASVEALMASSDLGGRSTKFDDRFPDATEPVLFFSLERPEIMALLIEKGARINQTNAFGKTALMYAAHLNLYDALDLLLKAKAEVNAVTSGGPSDLLEGPNYMISRSGRSALMYAAENASKKLIDRLIEAGADVHAMDSGGNGISYYLNLNPLLTQDEKRAISIRLN